MHRVARHLFASVDWQAERSGRPLYMLYFCRSRCWSLSFADVDLDTSDLVDAAVNN